MGVTRPTIGETCWFKVTSQSWNRAVASSMSKLASQFPSQTPSVMPEWRISHSGCKVHKGTCTLTRCLVMTASMDGIAKSCQYECCRRLACVSGALANRTYEVHPALADQRTLIQGPRTRLIIMSPSTQVLRHSFTTVLLEGAGVLFRTPTY